jgi:hypothetical protein
MTEPSEPTSSDVKPSGTAKPRARLGPTEIVTFPASDSEPEDLGDDDESFVEVNGEAEEEADFLKDYPEDTEVCHHHHTILHTDERNVGSPTPTSPSEIHFSPSPPIRPL